MALAVAVGFAAAAVQADEGVVVRQASDSAFEARGVEQLHRLLAAYDLERWVFTWDVVIQSRVQPHSHPVLTLNTRHLDDDEMQLSTFVHEQGHWYFEARKAAEEAAVDDLRSLYPDAPGPEGGGAREQYSTLLHLMVCALELDAMTALIGTEQARAVFMSNDTYPWVRARVLADDSSIRAVMAEHGLDDY